MTLQQGGGVLVVDVHHAHIAALEQLSLPAAVLLKGLVLAGADMIRRKVGEHAHMIKSVLEAAGRKVGMIGTNGIYYMGRHKETANTTPESYELQKTFREFLDAGCDTALMEVSSTLLIMWVVVVLPLVPVTPIMVIWRDGLPKRFALIRAMA